MDKMGGSGREETQVASEATSETTHLRASETPRLSRPSFESSAAEALAPSVHNGAAPYSSHEELFADIIVCVQIRARTAAAHRELLARGDRLASVWPDQLVAIEKQIDERLAQTESSPPLQLLRERLHLNRDEECILWTLIAHDLDPVAREWIRHVGTEDTADPTTDTLRRIVYGRTAKQNAWLDLHGEGRLRRLGLMVHTGPRDVPEHRLTWKASNRVLALAHGDLQLDGAVVRFASAGTVSCVSSELQVAGDAIAQAERAFDRGDLIVAVGRPGSGRRTLLSSIAGARGLGVLEVQGAALGRDRDAALARVRAIVRECHLLELVPLIRDLDRLGEDNELLDLLESELPWLTLATASRPIARRWRRPPTYVELGPISALQRRELWKRALPGLGDPGGDRLATMYPIAPALISATGLAVTQYSPAGTGEPRHIEAALRTVLDDRITNIATPIRTTQEWTDLILPEEQAELIVELKARISERTRVF
jgi:hypothetical protein